jgi:hypothetical protein
MSTQNSETIVGRGAMFSYLVVVDVVVSKLVVVVPAHEVSQLDFQKGEATLLEPSYGSVLIFEHCYKPLRCCNSRLVATRTMLEYSSFP